MKVYTLQPTVIASPNQVLTHTARAAAKQLNNQQPLVAAREGLWLKQVIASRASSPLLEQRSSILHHSPNQVLTHAARAAARQPFQPPLVAARGACEGLWLEQIDSMNRGRASPVNRQRQVSHHDQYDALVRAAWFEN